MADLEGPEGWPNVYQLSKQDPVVGGEPDPETGEGVDNIPHLQLFQRTKWLRTRVDQLLGLFSNGKAKDADKLDGEHASDLVKRDGSRSMTGNLRMGNNNVTDISSVGLDAYVNFGGLVGFLNARNALRVLTNNQQRLEVSDSKVSLTVQLDMNGKDLRNVDEIDFGGGNKVNYSPESGLQVFDNGEFFCRIGPDNFFSANVKTNGAFEAVGEMRSTGGNIRAISGYIYQQGDRMMSQRDDYGITAVVFARNEAGTELYYGDTISGSNLQAVSAGGANNNGDIGVGLWMCLGYAKPASASNGADRCTFFTRVQ